MSDDDESLTAEDIARLKWEAEDYAESVREADERAYEVFLRDRERRLS